MQCVCVCVAGGGGGPHGDLKKNSVCLCVCKPISLTLLRVSCYGWFDSSVSSAKLAG